jgi:hypothetical protein
MKRHAMVEASVVEQVRAKEIEAPDLVTMPLRLEPPCSWRGRRS